MVIEAAKFHLPERFAKSENILPHKRLAQMVKMKPVVRVIRIVVVRRERRERRESDIPLGCGTNRRSSNDVQVDPS